ncbi:type II toxin-antitoxin system prevent-host-death family antitoxin [Streptacidiphilus neutrinimicus]|uniref:type II toxin-antitoxin system prevent-host-death family antitoxin n=1 Tax=Streptacidiphilus neutrinimicus TaxID=105420 RepID=UPI0005A63886|nr:type II toxin-antitoxin system prevent-host-death family antitoxin [Streptacidiphilus neutrinimicus]
MTTHPFGDQVSVTRARCDLGPLVRWVAATPSRVAVTSRGTVAAVLISGTELAELDGLVRPREGAGRGHAEPGSSAGKT